MRVLMLLLASLVTFAGSLSAHNTLFGDAPRTIWQGGVEVEAESEWEIYRRFWEEDSSVDNPNDTRVQVWTYKFALTYGITRDLAMRVGFPVGYAIRRSQDTSLNDNYFGMKDMNIGFKYRVYNEPHPGGSFQSGVFAEFKLPTAQKRGLAGVSSPKISFGAESVEIKAGISWAYSTARQYFWIDLSGRVNTISDAVTKGASLVIHPAYAIRVFELSDYRDFDLILLFELDAEFAGNRWANRKEITGTAFRKFHVGGGVQMNVTNRVEIKMGYEWPFYQYYEARTFVHEGTAKFSFNYLF
ncbi:hypothetical protein OAU50_00950 [Planctomycetota bacterium]|nr:hypothetical protein [Planctomycetota bacterium]